MEKTLFEQRMKEFIDSSIDEAFQKHIRGDHRYELASRASKAFWQLLKTKVSAEDYEELLSAWLKVEEVQTNLSALEVNVYYLQGVSDGMRLAGNNLPAVGAVPAPLYRAEEMLANIERVEALASRNGAAEKVTV